MGQGHLHDLHKELLLRCKKGDSKAQYRLYQMYSKTLYNLILRMVENSMDAEDILQETFVQAFKSISGLKEHAAISSWLRRIAINKSLEFVRKRKLKFGELTSEVQITEENDDYSAISMENIHQEIKALPQGCRIVFTLYLLEDYSHKKIAKSLNISESTSKTQYKRAKQLLKESLKKHYERG